MPFPLCHSKSYYGRPQFHRFLKIKIRYYFVYIRIKFNEKCCNGDKIKYSSQSKTYYSLSSSFIFLLCTKNIQSSFTFIPLYLPYLSSPYRSLCLYFSLLLSFPISFSVFVFISLLSNLIHLFFYVSFTTIFSILLPSLPSIPSLPSLQSHLSLSHLYQQYRL